MKTLPISFHTAHKLCGLTELLPSGHEWQYCVLSPKVLTKSPVRLFYRDPVECLEAIFNHPLFHDKLDLVPHCVYQTTECLVHVYSVTISFLSHVSFLIYVVRRPYFSFAPSYQEIDLYLLAFPDYSSPLLFPL